jgi:hypothetical protein
MINIKTSKGIKARLIDAHLYAKKVCISKDVKPPKNVIIHGSEGFVHRFEFDLICTQFWIE